MTRTPDPDTRPSAGGANGAFGPLGMAALALTAILLIASTQEVRAQAQAQNAPQVQVICEVTGAVAQTVRVTYPTTAVRNTHVFRPVAGGPNVVFHAPATPTQVYSLGRPGRSLASLLRNRRTARKHPLADPAQCGDSDRAVYSPGPDLRARPAVVRARIMTGPSPRPPKPHGLHHPWRSNPFA